MSVICSYVHLQESHQQLIANEIIPQESKRICECLFFIFRFTFAALAVHCCNLKLRNETKR
jgi:hypothetical protein